MTTEGYRNKPQFNHNEMLNKDFTPDVPKFNSNALDNDNLMPLNNCHRGNGKKEEGHDHKHCNCGHNHK